MERDFAYSAEVTDEGATRVSIGGPAGRIVMKLLQTIRPGATPHRDLLHLTQQVWRHLFDYYRSPLVPLLHHIEPLTDISVEYGEPWWIPMSVADHILDGAGPTRLTINPWNVLPHDQVARFDIRWDLPLNKPDMVLLEIFRLITRPRWRLHVVGSLGERFARIAPVQETPAVLDAIDQLRALFEPEELHGLAGIEVTEKVIETVVAWVGQRLHQKFFPRVGQVMSTPRRDLFENESTGGRSLEAGEPAV